MKRELVERITRLKEGAVGSLVAQRIKEFKEFGKKKNEDWFNELCFCILTANSTARTGIKIQQQLGPSGFLNLPFEQLRDLLKKAGHRFYNTRAKYIVEARNFCNIKDIMRRFSNVYEAREWLVKNVLGIGYKEASHFLRNVGFDGVAILDRHVLAVLHSYKMIPRYSRSLTKRSYLDFEKTLMKFAQKINLPLAELDLYLWYMKTGEVLK